MSCSRSRRPPPGGAGRASPAPRGPSRASRPARRPGSARGWRWTCCLAARAWRSPPTPPPGMTAFAGVSEGELIGVLCAWDRVEAHAAARKLAAIAELARRNPAPEDAEFTADEIACALGESRARGYELMDTAGHLDTRLPGTRAALYDGTLSLGKARLIAAATAPAGPGRGPRRRGRGAGPGGPADPGRAARRDRPRRDGGRPREGEGSGGRPRRGSPGWSGGPRTPATPR